MHQNRLKMSTAILFFGMGNIAFIFIYEFRATFNRGVNCVASCWHMKSDCCRETRQILLSKDETLK